MKNAIFTLLIILLCSLSAFAEYFDIENYDVRIELQTDGSFWVHETIDVVFKEQRRGIFRSIPVNYKVEPLPQGTQKAQREGLIYDIYLDSISVENWEYTEVKSEGYLNIRIGSPDKYIEGKQQYKIHFKVYNAINFFPNHSEFYWNVIGTEWDVPILQSSFRIELPQFIPAEKQAYQVFAGSLGAKEKVFTESFDGQVLEGQSQRALNPKEGVSAVFAFQENYLEKKPLPMSVIADKYYLKKLDTDITFSENGTAKVRETYIIHFLKPTYPIYRDFDPTIGWQSPLSTPKIIGGEYRYGLQKVKGENISYNAAYQSFYLNTEDVEMGTERVFEVEYETYGNFLAAKNSPDFLQFDNPLSKYWQWPEPVESATVTLHFPEGRSGSKVEAIVKGNGKTISVDKKRTDLNTVVINTKEMMLMRERLDYEILVPKDFFDSSWLNWLNLVWKNNWILFLPFFIFGGLYWLWLRKGKDEEFSVATQYRPPSELTPAESGILIDDKLHDRDLLALIPYWATNGHLKIKEIREERFLGLSEKIDFEFQKLKELPVNAHTYENTLFNGIFKSGNTILLSSLTNKFHTTMQQAREELETQIKKRSFYVPRTRGCGTAMLVFGTMALVGGLIAAVFGFGAGNQFQLGDIAITVLLSGIMLLIFGRIMPKKAPIGMDLYKKLAGFREFVKSAEAHKLETFLKEDPNYFDKTLPYAIVFDLADKWAAKFEGLSIQPPEPNWYQGSYNNFNTHVFMDSLSNGMKQMGNTFVSYPSSSGGSSSFGGSGGSFSGGGGFSGGGFGGGGGGSW
ncbi:MAG: DUF2207 domain-containing protein [Chitinophagales bacterium]